MRRRCTAPAGTRCRGAGGSACRRPRRTAWTGRPPRPRQVPARAGARPERAVCAVPSSVQGFGGAGRTPSLGAYRVDVATEVVLTGTGIPLASPDRAGPGTLVRVGDLSLQ